MVKIGFTHDLYYELCEFLISTLIGAAAILLCAVWLTIISLVIYFYYTHLIFTIVFFSIGILKLIGDYIRDV